MTEATNKNDFTLNSLEDLEIVRVQMTLFNGSEKEITMEGSLLKNGVAPFKEFVEGHDIKFDSIKELRVETFSGRGGAYGRSRSECMFKPIDW